MINVLYVGGDNISLLNGSSDQVNIDYVQNGMIALTAVQTSDFDAVIVEDKLPLMTLTIDTRAFKANTTIPIISLVRSMLEEKHYLLMLVWDFLVILNRIFKRRCFSRSVEISKRFHDFKKQVPKISLRHFTGRGFEKIVGYSELMLSIYHLMTQIKSKDVTTILYGESGTGKI